MLLHWYKFNANGKTKLEHSFIMYSSENLRTLKKFRFRVAECCEGKCPSETANHRARRKMRNRFARPSGNEVIRRYVDEAGRVSLQKPYQKICSIIIYPFPLKFSNVTITSTINASQDTFIIRLTVAQFFPFAINLFILQMKNRSHEHSPISLPCCR